jgi:pseudaminic acid synthase
MSNSTLTFQIGDRAIGPDAPPFIIAEMSGNHNGSLERALKIVEAASRAGADALKLQTYTADTMTLNVRGPGFVVEDPTSLWSGRSLYDLYQEASTPWEWHKAIFDHCRKLGLIAFSTPFDVSAVEFLESLDVKLYKIASAELVDIPLIRRVARTGKPMLMSTGMAAQSEIEEAVKEARAHGCPHLVLLKCTSMYPASPADSHLRTLPDIQKRYQCQVGLSDHTLGLGASIASVSMGATVIERHFTLSRAEGGIDSAFSLEPQELNALVEGSRVAWEALGEIHYGPTEREKNSLLYRRSLYVCGDMKAGDIFTPENLRAIRPGLGLAPRHLDAVLGRRITRDARRGTPLSSDLVEGLAHSN